MHIQDIKLPTNRKFGFFVCFILFIIFIFFFDNKFNIFDISLFILFILFFLISLFIPNILYLPNKLWMRFGFLIGKIINPIILSFIYFFIITPTSLILNLFGRDELSLKFKKSKSYWKFNSQTKNYKSFFEKQY